MRLLFLAISIGISGCSIRRAADSPTAPIEDPVYAHPQQLIEVAPGRRLNLYCTGTGSPTVVFDSGQAAETSEWGLVQPAIAKVTRACSYDRAGVGFSDPSRRASSSSNIVDDLHVLLRAASIGPPYVLVGHSYGGMNIKLFAYRYPSEVAGLVFVDPSHEDQRESYRKLDPRNLSPQENDRIKLEPTLVMRRECIAGAPISAGTPLWIKCVGEPDSRYSPEINAAHARIYASASFQAASMSEEEATFHASAAQLRAERRQLGDLPLVVLTSDTLGPQTKETELPANPQFKLWVALHDDIASLSTRGSNRIVRRSGHMVHTDQPRAVIDAIAETVAAARQR
jgi:pimeloyl-ACP methyl ester carboxylesterase